jgi:polynucleotide 5'-hydroxyl-kinase GRC3/NOL9
MSAAPSGSDALERVAASRVAMVLGDVDSGKTTLVASLAGALAARGRSVAVVDADLGQSEVGPPGTVGLGRVRGSGRADGAPTLADAEVLALHWVGSFSPPGFEAPLRDGARRLADRGRRLGFDHVIVDTCGLVRGERGRAVKAGLIADVAPDLVIVLGHRDECAAILRDLPGRPDTARLTLPVAAAARRRSAGERRRHREQALDVYFAPGAVRRIPIDRLEPDSRRRSPSELAGVLAGLVDAADETLGIGRIVRVDVDGCLLIETPVAADRIARVAPGVEKLRSESPEEVGNEWRGGAARGRGAAVSHRTAKSQSASLHNVDEVTA